MFISAISQPSLPAAFAASAAAVIASSDRPSSSSRSVTCTADAFTSLSTFWLKVVESVASSEFIAVSLSLSASERLAPARTNSVW